MQLNTYLCNKLRRWAAPQPLGDEGDACLESLHNLIVELPAEKKK